MQVTNSLAEETRIDGAVTAELFSYFDDIFAFKLRIHLDIKYIPIQRAKKSVRYMNFCWMGIGSTSLGLSM